MTAYDLSQRFTTDSPPVLLTGVQAIARMLIEQRAADRRAGQRSATFVSGYQGSPLGGVDKLLLSMPDVMAANDIHVQPGLNEELAATSVWGSQSSLPLGEATHDGVIGVWYGKAPGVDRATDPLRHLSMYGVHPRGGVVILAGDDPAAKSSTVPAVSERTLAALGIPVFFPRNSTEIITMGVHAVALSRACGSPVALKIVADVADGAWVVDVDAAHATSVVPPLVWEGEPWTYRQSPPLVGSAAIVAVEAQQVGPRAAMVQAYLEANGLNPMTAVPQARLGLVASGPSFDSMHQALRDLGVDDAALDAAGVRLMRLGMVWPAESAAVRRFAEGLDRIVVVEDKTSFIESQVREILYGRAGAPQVHGKRDADAMVLVPADGELTPGRLLEPLRRVLGGIVTDFVQAAPPRIPLPLLPVRRVPYFCSGCPHNRSTVVPEGSMAAGGIGCHTLVTMAERQDSAVTGFTQMGGEGAQWIGQSPFTSAGHIFQNVGDGTYFHSGQLAVQACVAAGVNITYKLLHNDVVAMTGAQDAEGALSIAQITHKLAAEGVSRTIVVAEEPARHRARDLAAGVQVWPRDRLDEAQRTLREVPGVTVLIYDQHCANDARRQRKRGTLPTRTMRVVINEDVCEGCGDCGVKSNCLSVQPVQTELGDKTRIEQTSCNTDYSCLEGDCPAFMTVEAAPRKAHGAKGSRGTGAGTAASIPQLPAPAWEPPTTTQSILMTGVGGTGIVTVNQVLATAAHLAGYEVEVLDQIGLSQKAGPVIGHLRFAPTGLEPSNRVTAGRADAILAFDLLTAAEPGNLAYGDPARTVAVASTSVTPTGNEVYDRTHAQAAIDVQLDRLRTAVRSVHVLDMLGDTQTLLGSTTAANFLLVGAAVQSGALRLPPDAVESAIEVNGVSVAANVAAFRWGRVSVSDPVAFTRAVAVDSVAAQAHPTPVDVPALAAAVFTGEVRRLAEVRAPDLVGFADLACAEDYVRVLDAVWRAERAVTDRTELSEAVARYLYKLTAYKDEYEVARLLTRSESTRFVDAAVPGGTDLTFRLHPPMLRALGRSKKIGFAGSTQAALRALVPMKRLRGTPLDPFGRAHVRKVERELLRHYRTVLHGLVAELTAENYSRATEFAGLPDIVRGYEDVKLRNVERYRERLRALGLPDLHTT